MDPDRMLMTVAKVPLMFEPNTTAPVYFGGSLAAIPYAVFWKTPPATSQTKRIIFVSEINHANLRDNSLLSTTTDAIVTQKNVSGQAEESTIARITVMRKMMISMIKLQTTRFVRSPLLNA